MRCCPIMRVIHLKGGQLGSDARPNQLQKIVLPALFHLRYPSQSHQRSARGRTHTSDDSYIYQLTLVVATATVSYSVRISSRLKLTADG